VGDDQLITECLGGNAAAYRSLVERHAGDVRAFLRSRASDGGRADDAATEAFTRAWLRLPSLRRPASFGAWVKGIGLRILLEHAPARGASPDEARPDGPLACPSDPALADAMAQLPEPMREVLHLRFFAGLSCGEIARREEVPIGTVTKRLSRAYAALRDILHPPEVSP